MAGTRLPARPKSQTMDAAAATEVGWNPKGLCIDCAMRGRCSFVRREGGVWRCEEYR